MAQHIPSHYATQLIAKRIFNTIPFSLRYYTNVEGQNLYNVF